MQCDATGNSQKQPLVTSWWMKTKQNPTAYNSSPAAGRRHTMSHRALQSCLPICTGANMARIHFKNAAQSFHSFHTHFPPFDFTTCLTRLLTDTISALLVKFARCSQLQTRTYKKLWKCVRFNRLTIGANLRTHCERTIVIASICTLTRYTNKFIC